MVSGVEYDKSRVDDVLRTLNYLQNYQIEIGIFGDSEGGDLHSDSGITVVEIATIHEFGAPRANIPERSFIRAGWDKYKGQIESVASRMMNDVFDGKISVDAYFETVGVFTVGRIQEYLRSSQGMKPLKQATIQAKGSSKPLIDTGQLIGSITHRVRRRSF